MGNHSEDVSFKPTTTVPIPTKDILSWIFDQPTYSEEEPIYIDAADPKHSLNAKQCKALIRGLIAGFRALKLTKGECVCIHAFNNIYYPCVFLAVVGAGLIWAGTNPGYTEYELIHHLKTSSAKIVIAEPDLYSKILPAARSCGISDENVFQFDWSSQDRLTNGRPKSWRTLMQHGEEDWVTFDDFSTATSTPACRLFSSGTTGLPKAASLTHYNIIAQHTIVHEYQQARKPYKVKRILCLPFFHAAMVPIGHTTPLRAGHVSYVMRRFDLEPFLDYTERYGITEVFLVPPIIVTILQSPLIRKYSLKSLRWGLIGGAPLDVASLKRFNALMNADGRINCCWGMTECSCVGAGYHFPDADTTGSIGSFMPNLEVKLVDDDGQDIRDYNSKGEIWIRGPTVIRNYYDNAQADATSFTEDWFHTGDIAYCDGVTKKWYMVDRKKELIKIRGFQVAPAELESALMSHPLVIDAAVIGIPARSAVDGEAARAYIVRKSGSDGQQLREADVKQYIADRLAKYKQLNGGVIFVEEIPKTASGKYLKRQLREQAEQEVGGLSKL